MSGFCIWDENARRAMEIKRMLIKAMDGRMEMPEIVIHSEPPMLARHHMTGNTPAIEYQDTLWHCKGNMTETRVRQLVEKILLHSPSG